MTVRKLARIQGRPGQAAALRQALAALEQATREEPGCLEFAFYQAITEDDAFVLVEAFADQAALDAHMAQPHTRAFFARQLVAGVQAHAIT